jgi:hypothetical protein
VYASRTPSFVLLGRQRSFFIFRGFFSTALWAFFNTASSSSSSPVSNFTCFLIIVGGQLYSKIYTQRTSKIGLCRRRAAIEFCPACIAKLFKFSCNGLSPKNDAFLETPLAFGIGKAGQIQGASLTYYQLLKFFGYSFERSLFHMAYLFFTSTL